MKSRNVVVLGAMSLTIAGAAWAAAPDQAPKPGPEHKRLGYFVANWTTEGEMKPSPFGAGGKIAMKDSCKWFDGGFAVVCHGEGKGPAGPMKSIGILGYSSEEKAYTYAGLDNTSMTQTTIPRGKLEGDTWTYEDESKMGGHMVKSRYVIKELGPTAYTFKWESMGEDGKWATVMDGKSTKIQTKK